LGGGGGGGGAYCNSGQGMKKSWYSFVKEQKQFKLLFSISIILTQFLFQIKDVLVLTPKTQRMIFGLHKAVSYSRFYFHALTPRGLQWYKIAIN
jgi:hypothetical protein